MFAHIRLPERPEAGGQRLLSEFTVTELDYLRHSRASGASPFPYPVFPEPGGVLPWGTVRSPGLAYWLTGPGDPDDWPVIAATEEGDYWDRFDGPACEFLAEVAAGRYDASGFRDLYRENGEEWISLQTRPVFTPDPVVPVPGPGTGPPDSPMSGGADWALRLAELVGIAANEHRSFDWAAIEGDLGVRLPTGTCPCGPAEVLLREHVTEIDREIARLSALRAELTVMLAGLSDAEKACPELAPGTWCAPPEPASGTARRSGIAKGGDRNVLVLR